MRTAYRHGREILSCGFARPVLFLEKIGMVGHGKMGAYSGTRLGCPPLRYVNDECFIDSLAAGIVEVERATN